MLLIKKKQQVKQLLSTKSETKEIILIQTKRRRINIRRNKLLNGFSIYNNRYNPIFHSNLQLCVRNRYEVPIRLAKWLFKQ